MKNSVYSKEYKKFLQLMIKARKDAGITQQELANKLDKPQSFVSKYEQGERRLDVVEFIKITKLLGSKPKEIIDKLFS